MFKLQLYEGSSKHCLRRRGEWHLETLAAELLDGYVKAPSRLEGASDCAAVDAAKATLADHERAAEAPGSALELLEGENAEGIGPLRQRQLPVPAE